MSVKRNDESTVVIKNVNNTNLDIRMVFKHKGEGKKRSVESSTYGIFSTKNNVKDGFKNVNLAIAFLTENIGKYDKKRKKFK
jgi:hypothetical protein